MNIINVTTTSTASSCGAAQAPESLASAGSIQATYERVLPWVVVRWNHELRRFERWHNWYGFWRACTRKEAAWRDVFVSFADTWAEPIDSNDEPESYRQLPSTRGIARKTGGRRG